ncbi:hypothetical protein [Arthrobacter cryoconiti]|uniref:SHOCT domain-containing protein n=1 Tax=Arthrobacter cryoconiti TaxID=748907 RepID=A0ABV8R2W8_9MICC|nr:hypothetical protein [Arthrobacter cryoconiti]MCC9067135.1 hypothetical protein [Arthrobacter cryoconiti]
MNPLAGVDVASSASTSSFFQPWFVFVIVGIAMLSSVLRAANRKKRAAEQSRNGYPSSGRSIVAASLSRDSTVSGQHAGGLQGTVARNTAVPYQGTLLNGIPIKGYGSDPNQMGAGFANERMKAEAELKRQLDALDTARRAGQVTAEQYAMHREAIFKNF